MIIRVGSLLLLLYALCFVLFAFTLGRPAQPNAPATDAGVVLTGAPGRIEHAIDVLKSRKVERLLVDGVDPAVTKADLARRIAGSATWFGCCVDLGSESVDTRSNAEEASRWLSAHKYRSLRLITSDWHMRRALYEFHRALPKRYEIVADAVRTEPSFLTLFGEYNKYLLRRIAAWIDL
ncbi:MAG TPA: YdcF family protein [Sphingomicrobium sp.]|nr:YdcF family protein [Sphingomicrobium sp.]